MRIEIKRSPSGRYWALRLNGRFVGNYDTRRQAREDAEKALRGLLCNAVPPT